MEITEQQAKCLDNLFESLVLGERQQLSQLFGVMADISEQSANIFKICADRAEKIEKRANDLEKRAEKIEKMIVCP